MNKKAITQFFILVIFFSTSCTTYLIPIDSFKQQFNNIESTNLREVLVYGPIGDFYNYLANPIDTIRCEDKNGNVYGLKNSPSIEIRFTHGVKNKKTVFYFDRIFVNDDSVIGVQSRFVSAIRKTIPLDSITKIEVQDGRKKFQYSGN